MSRQTPRTSIESPASTDAKNYVAAPTGVTNEQEYDDIGQQATRVMSSTGPARESLDRPVLDKVSETPMDGEYIAMMSFLREKVKIQIAESADDQAEQVFEINVNGHLEFFRRGETKVVPRYIVDRMLRLKETRFKQTEVYDKEGTKSYAHIPVTTLKYDFAIVGDANPLGEAWRKAVRAEVG